jgi:simple sugar transport system permease protein
MKNRTLQIALLFLPVILSLLISAALVLLVGQNPVAVLQTILEGAFRDTRALGQVVNFWIPLTFVSMGLLVTFTAGLWNIGVEGQMAMGAVFATVVALNVPLPAPLSVIVEIAMAVLGGVLWALLVGVLKTRLGVHEIFGGVALNAIASLAALYVIGGRRATPAFPPEALLLPMSDDFRVSGIILIILALSVFGVIFALRRTRWGLQLKATGKNARSALLLGVPTGRSALSAFAVCGMLAGFAGAYRVLLIYGDLRPGVSGGIGFLGLLVVLLSTAQVLWLPPLIAFVFAAILGGSTLLKLTFQLDSSLAGVLQGFLVLIALLTNGLRARLGEGRDMQPAPPAPAPQPDSFAPVQTVGDERT